MNLILFDETHKIDTNKISLDARQREHVRKVLKSQTGDKLRVGEKNTLLGEGVITKLSDECIELEIELKEKPVAASNVSLIIALPRPKSLPRVIQTATSLGVKKMIFTHAYKVAKDFWSSDYLSEQTVNKACVLGLEQCRDTIMPEVVFERRFKPFVEDRLPSLIEGQHAFLAHPYSERDCPVAINEPVTVAIGPEGGWIDYEVDLFEKTGFQKVKLSERILKLETAVTALVSRIS